MFFFAIGLFDVFVAITGTGAWTTPFLRLAGGKGSELELLLDESPSSTSWYRLTGVRTVSPSLPAGVFRQQVIIQVRLAFLVAH
ncbi:MAG: hypothetical protein ACLT8E_00180 [Akkermansia sp.]